MAAVGTKRVRYHEKNVKNTFYIFFRNFQFHRRGPTWTFWNIKKIYKDRQADILMMNENDINYYWREFCTRYEVYLGRIEDTSLGVVNCPYFTRLILN